MGSLRVGHDWATSLSLSCTGEGNVNPLQYSCLENPRDGGAWWAAVYGVAQSRTRLKRLSSSSSSWDSKTPHSLTSERVSWYLETSPPSRLHPRDGSQSLTLLSHFLSFIFCPTSFRREWAAFLGAWCPLQAFRSCFVEVAQHSNDLLMNFGGKSGLPILFLWHLGQFPPELFLLEGKD